MSGERSKLPVGVRRKGGGSFQEFHEIYIDDLKGVAADGGYMNKYMVVNIAAKRARQLNERDLPTGELARKAKKPTTQALLELVEGRLEFEAVEQEAALPEDESYLLDESPDDEVEVLMAELPTGGAEEDAAAPVKMRDDGEFVDEYEE